MESHGEMESLGGMEKSWWDGEAMIGLHLSGVLGAFTPFRRAFVPLDFRKYTV